MGETLAMQAGAGLRPVRPEKSNDGRGRSAQAEDHQFGRSAQTGALAMGSATFGRASGGFT